MKADLTALRGVSETSPITKDPLYPHRRFDFGIHSRLRVHSAADLSVRQVDSDNEAISYFPALALAIHHLKNKKRETPVSE